MKTMKKIVAILAVALMLCSILPLSVSAADTYELATSIEVGDTVVLVCESKKMELSGISTTSTKYGIGTAYSSSPAGAYVLTVEAGSTSGTYSFKCPNGQYLYWTSGNSLATNATKSASTSWTVTFSGNNAIIKNAKDTARQLQWNASSPRFACYGNSGQTAVQLFKKVTEPEVPSACEHKNAQYEHNCQPTICPDCEETLPAKADHSYNENVTLAPTCTTAGEKTLTCACGDVKTEAVNPLGHNYVDGACDVCGEAQPLEVTIDTFANTGVLGDKVISWTNGNFSVVNKKGSSSNDIRTSDTDHFRLYVGNTFTVSGGAMTKVVINCVSGYPVNDSTNKVSDGWTVTANGTAITYTATNGSADELTITIGKQSRVKSVVITPYVEAPSDCEHDYVSEETQAPTCTTEGVMTYTCSKCEDSYTEAIAVIPHSYVEDVIDATCTSTGTKTYECSVCFHSYDETIPVKAHNYVDDVCADCGHVKAYKGTITFDDTAKRTEFTTAIQVWEENGVIVTNNKGSSTTNVADYSDPARFYKNSELIVEFPDMISLVFNTKEGANDLASAIGNNAKVDGNTVTVTFAESQDSFSVVLTAGKVFVYNITAIVAHECTYDSVVTDPTCVNGGYTTNTCTKCGDSNVSDATEALGHTYAHDFDVDCDVCGAERAIANPITFGGKSISEDVSGLAFRFNVAVDGMEVNGTTAIYDNATINGYKLISMGAIVSNEKSELDIPAVYLCDLEDHSAAFAVRVVKIPAANYDSEITAIPYFVLEIGGEQVTIYGEAQTGTYNGVSIG